MEDKKTEEHVSLRIPLELHTQILEQFPNERTKAGKYLAFIRSRIQMDQNVYKSQEEVPTGLTLDQVRDLIQEELASLEIPSGEDITKLARDLNATNAKVNSFAKLLYKSDTDKKIKALQDAMNTQLNSIRSSIASISNTKDDKKPSSTNKPIENTSKPISEESLVNQWMNKTSSYDPEIHLPPGEDDDSPSLDV